MTGMVYCGRRVPEESEMTDRKHASSHYSRYVEHNGLSHRVRYGALLICKKQNKTIIMFFISVEMNMLFGNEIIQLNYYYNARKDKDAKVIPNPFVIQHAFFGPHCASFKTTILHSDHSIISPMLYLLGLSKRNSNGGRMNTFILIP